MDTLEIDYPNVLNTNTPGENFLYRSLKEYQPVDMRRSDDRTKIINLAKKGLLIYGWSTDFAKFGFVDCPVDIIKSRKAIVYTLMSYELNALSIGGQKSQEYAIKTWCESIWPVWNQKTQPAEQLQIF